MHVSSPIAYLAVLRLAYLILDDKVVQELEGALAAHQLRLVQHLQTGPHSSVYGLQESSWQFGFARCKAQTFSSFSESLLEDLKRLILVLQWSARGVGGLASL